MQYFISSASASRSLRFLVISIAAVTVACHETTSPSGPTRLTFIIEPPSSTIAGTQILPAVAVAEQDENGNTVTAATDSITMTIGTNPSAGTLSGKTTVAAVNGVATFYNLVINNAGSGYTLTAVRAHLASAVSNPFEVKAGTAAKLAFTVQPVGAISSTSMPTVTVTVQDASGNAVTNANNVINVAIKTSPTGGTLSGATSVAAQGGIAAFSTLSIDRAGAGYTLSATSLGLAGVVSQPFSITPGPASTVVFLAQPFTTGPGVTMTPAVAVAVQDNGGNLVSTGFHSITVAIGVNPSGATLSGTTTVTAVNGVATFNTLSIDKPGANYTLTATSLDLRTSMSVPFSIRNPLKFTTATAGYFHTCGIATDGASYCWGDNGSGQLGITGSIKSFTATELGGGLIFARVSAGRDHTCGVTTGGVGYCWGSNAVSQLGNGGVPSGVPSPVSGGLTFAEVTAGYDHSCGVTASGAGYCWGDNTYGELGNGTLTPINSVPSAVSGGLTFAAITPGRYFTCGVTTAGVPYCWGTNDAGELGDGTQTRRPSPVAVSGGLVFATASAGGFHACGLTTAGAAYCWGSNNYGELGNGTLSFSTVPVAVSGGLVFTALSVGNRHTCGVTADGTGYCWGENSDGKLGDGTLDSRSTPTQVAGGLAFSSISAGRFHSCGVTTSNEGYCWGSNGAGALGDGGTINSAVPVRVR